MKEPPPTKLESAPPLRLVFWETTTACNLACKHCRRLEPQTEPAPEELATEQGKELLKNFLMREIKND